jgi:hypothetical protein
MAIREDDRAAYLAGEDRSSLPVAARAELDEMRELLATEATWVEPGPGVEERVVAAVASEAAAAGGSPAATERRRPTRARGRWFSSRPTLAFGGLVTAALVAVAVVLAGGESRSPQRFAMVVSGTALAPQASGSATLTKTGSGWRIELSAAGLPHLEGGRYYEAWLKSPAGVLVPVGTFNDARRITLWAGVPPTSFPGLSVTRQRAGAGPASSGERVLTGTIRSAR